MLTRYWTRLVARKDLQCNFEAPLRASFETPSERVFAVPAENAEIALLPVSTTADVPARESGSTEPLAALTETEVGASAFGVISPLVNSDANGDGRGDVFWQNEDGKLAIWYLNGAVRSGGDEVTTNPGPTWHVRGTGDFNGDGKADVIWQNDDSRLAVWLMNGATILADGVVGDTPGIDWRIAGTGDFNGDGKSDALWQNTYDGRLAVWLLNGTSFGATAVVGTTARTNLVTRGGDFDGDGKSDILIQNKDGSVTIWFMNGTTVQSSATVATNPGALWKIQDTGDFNGDGKADIVWRNDNGSVAVWLMNGSTLASAGTVPINPGNTWTIAGVVDSNADGKSDILWQNLDGEAAVWLMNGTTRTGGDDLSPNPGKAWDVVNRATPLVPVKDDFDGDGRADLLFQNDDGSLGIWFMNGATRVSDAVLSVNPGAGWHVRGTGDFNSDGRADIMLQHDDGTVDIWMMKGATRLGSGPVATNPGSSWTIASAADFNGDGKADILLKNGTQMQLWVMDGNTITTNTTLSAGGAGTNIIAATGLWNNQVPWWYVMTDDGDFIEALSVDGTSINLTHTLYHRVSSSTAGWTVRGAPNFDIYSTTDLLWTHSNGDAGIWTGQLSHIGYSWKSANLGKPGAGFTVKGAADLNADGLSDILWQNDSTGQVALWLMSGTQKIGGGTLISNPGTAWHLVSGVGG